MNNAGINNPDTKPKHEDEESTSKRRSPLVFLLLAGVVVVSLVIGFQAFGILYSIIFPPSPPIPDDVIEIRHDNIGYGVDDWLYRTQSDACEVVTYYESIGGECRRVPGQCGGDDDAVSFNSSTQQVATCIGEEKFSLFAYRWEANIATGYQYDDGETQFNLFREVFWTGAVPPRLDPRQGFEFED